jgi:cytochrome c biogenesis protein CcmG, thiol:disulfide interchange protein DsbE
MQPIRPLLFAIAALGAAGCTTETPRTPSPTVGQPLAPIHEEYLFGVGPRSLEEARGMAVVLDFWATYCDPCRRSFPEYEKLHRGGGVAVIAVAMDEGDDVAADAIKDFADSTGASFAVLWDKDQSSLDAYGLRKMPTAFVVDRKGILRYIHGGYEASTLQDLEAEVAALVAEGGPAPAASP